MSGAVGFSHEGDGLAGESRLADDYGNHVSMSAFGCSTVQDIPMSPSRCSVSPLACVNGTGLSGTGPSTDMKTNGVRRRPLRRR
jgi:hypothetical protein